MPSRAEVDFDVVASEAAADGNMTRPQSETYRDNKTEVTGQVTADECFGAAPSADRGVPRQMNSAPAVPIATAYEDNNNTVSAGSSNSLVADTARLSLSQPTTATPPAPGLTAFPSPLATHEFRFLNIVTNMGKITSYIFYV